MVDKGQPRTGARAFALYPLRFGMALVFAYTGLEKLVDPEGQAAIATFLGLPAPEATTLLVGSLEALGAAALLAGVMTRTAAAGLSAFLLAVLVFLKVPGPFWQDGWGIDLAVLAGTVTLALNGPGRPTVWSMLGREDPEPVLYQRMWGLWRPTSRA